MRFSIIVALFLMILSSSSCSETYNNNQSNQEISVPKKSEYTHDNRKNELLYEQSEEYSEQLAVKLDRYIELVSNNPESNDIDTKYNEIESLFAVIGNICKKMGDAEYYKMRGEHVKAAEIANCNGRRYVLAPYVANAILKTAKYYAGKGDKATAKRMYRDVIVRFTGLKYQSQVKEAEFGLEDLKQ